MDGVLLYTCCPLSHPHSTVRFLMNDLPLYFTLTFITILSPGAGVLFTVTSALRSGFQDAWQAPLGNVLASACVAVACAAGIGAILTASPLVFSIVQGLSALVLLYLAWRSWHAPANGFASLADPAAAVHHPSAPPCQTAARRLAFYVSLFAAANEPDAVRLSGFVSASIHHPVRPLCPAGSTPHRHFCRQRHCDSLCIQLRCSLGEEISGKPAGSTAHQSHQCPALLLLRR